jgi:hypothetical protein
MNAKGNNNLEALEKIIREWDFSLKCTLQSLPVLFPFSPEKTYFVFSLKADKTKFWFEPLMWLLDFTFPLIKFILM